MPALSAEIQTFIVTALAMYDTPTQIAGEVKERFGVTMDRQQVAHYDPERAGKPPGEQWVKLHAQVRADFLAEKTKVPIAQRAVRLRELARLYRIAVSGNRLPLAAQLLEQAAKESGDFFTNKRVLEAADPAAALAKILGCSPDELTEMVSALGCLGDGGGGA